MNDIEKINEELRNYKLYKIQRAYTREQEFTSLKSDLLKIRKNEIVNHIVIFINVLMVIFLIYNVCASLNDKQYYEVNSFLIGLNFIGVVFFSLYLSYIFFKYNRKLKHHIKISEQAIQYFKNEGENLKSIYENYVDNYLEAKK